MAIVKRDYLFELMRKQKTPFWEVMDGTTPVASYEDENVEIENSINELSDCLNNIESGYCTVKVSTRSKSEKAGGGNVKTGSFVYRVKCGEAITGIKESTGGNSALLQQIDQLKREMIELKHSQELKDIRREFDDKLADLENDSDDNTITGTVMKQIAPHLPNIIGKLTGINITAPSLNGPETITTTEGHTATPDEAEELAQQKKKCSAACGLLLSVDKHAGDHLLALGILAKNKPDVYMMALGQLKALQA